MTLRNGIALCVLSVILTDLVELATESEEL